MAKVDNTKEENSLQSKINELSSVDDVVKWAKQFVKPVHAEKLQVQEINGKSLLDLDALSLKRCGFPVGPASILANEIVKLKGGAQGYPPFSPSNYSFNYPTFEPNDEGLPLIERNEQVEKIKNTISNLSFAEKYEPIVISTSRGMGKTFLMKRLVRTETDSQSPIPEIEAAYHVGRIVTMECTLIKAEFQNNIPAYSKFWHVAIIYNLLQTFKGTSVDGINFDERDIIGIYGYCDESLTKNLVTSLDKWIFSAIHVPVKDLCLEMIRLTNIAFKTNSNAKPVFLLDNVHCLARIKTDIQSQFDNTLYHTVLSKIINQLSEYRPPCIVAGTTDGNLKLVTDYSNYVPRFIFLTTLTMQGAFTMGANLLRSRLGKGIHWPADPAKDPLLLAMVYETCQIPRLLKLAFLSWHEGQKNKNNNSFIMEHFHNQARRYYEDAIRFITTLSARDCAILMMCCSVNYKISSQVLPSTKVEIKNLIDASIIFPQINNTYVIPVFLWINLDLQTAQMAEITGFKEIFSHWEKVLQEMTQLVPGLCFDNLFIYSKKWWSAAFSLNAVGEIWENLVTSSLVVKYCLHTLEKSPKPDIPLSDIYYISKRAQAYPMISNLKVNFSDGIQFPLKEVTVNDNPYPNALVHNRNIQKAHHDIIIRDTAVSCKCTLDDPQGGKIELQLDSCVKLDNPQGGKIELQLDSCVNLLWFYPGLKELKEEDANLNEVELPPVNFRKKKVKDALARNCLGFLSGASCVSHLSYEMIILLKKLVQQR